MATFKFDMIKYVSKCINSLESCNYDNSGLWKIIAPCTLTFGDVTLKKCYTCKLYIHPRLLYKHIKYDCQNYSAVDSIGKIECICGERLTQNKYSRHLLAETRINYMNYLSNRRR